jgi:hypothetical protein
MAQSGNRVRNGSPRFFLCHHPSDQSRLLENIGGKEMSDQKPLTKAKDLKAELDKLGVAYNKKATVKELQDALSAAMDRKGAGIHPANDPICEIFSKPMAGHPECLACAKAHSKRFDACQIVAEEAKAAGSNGGPKGPSSKVKGKYKTFGELKENLEQAPEKLLTMVVDKLLLEGHTVKDILEEVEARKETQFTAGKPGHNDFKNEARIKRAGRKLPTPRLRRQRNL